MKSPLFSAGRPDGWMIMPCSSPIGRHSEPSAAPAAIRADPLVIEAYLGSGAADAATLPGAA